MRSKKPLFIGSLCVFLVLIAESAHTQSSTNALAPRLQALVEAAHLTGQIGIDVRDVATGQSVYALQPQTPLNPASNMKVVTTAAALMKLGPEFHMQTGLYGRIENGVIGDLVIRGRGDPTLSEADLIELAQQLEDRGVRSVERIHVDGSYFDDQLLPPAFDQQPNEQAYFRAAVGAVAVDRSSFVLRVLPGAQPGVRANVRIHGAGYFEIRNEITTSEGGEPIVNATQAPLGTDRMSLRLTGSVPAGILGVSYRRRIENPLAYAGHLLGDALTNVGIRGTHAVRIDAGPSGLPMLASHDSRPLTQILAELGKHSDNFVAEMILKVLGAERRRPGSSQTGVEVLHEVLGTVGIAQGQATFVNGSGLFRGNQIAPAHVTQLLTHVYRNPTIQSDFISQLAIGGVDGTLSNRMQDIRVRRVVRAKTGTLNDVIALSGYVLGPSPNRALAFSFIANRVGGQQGPARQLADQLVRTMVEHLHQ